jgi:hypothetical protein
MVTHSSTSRPVQCLCMAERTGCPVLTDLWSYVLIRPKIEKTKILSHCGSELETNLPSDLIPSDLSPLLIPHSSSPSKTSDSTVA